MKNTAEKPIDPEKLYTTSDIADRWGVDIKWVKEHLIYNRSCRHKKQGAIYLILGAWLIEWAKFDHNNRNEDPRDQD